MLLLTNVMDFNTSTSNFKTYEFNDKENASSTEEIKSEDTHKLLVSSLSIFGFIGISCLVAIIFRNISTKLKEMCGFKLSRSESARKSKPCHKEEDDF